MYDAGDAQEVIDNKPMSFIDNINRAQDIIDQW